MTDKEVIIDGVNVTPCFWRATNKIGNDIGTYCRCYTGSCKGQDCYYKQLQRLQAENEELKKQLQNPDVIVALTDVRTGERELWYKKGLKSDRYKQALVESKETLKHYSETTLGELQSDGTYRYLLNNNSINGKQYLTYDPRPAKEALNKINEVLK